MAWDNQRKRETKRLTLYSEQAAKENNKCYEANKNNANDEKTNE